MNNTTISFPTPITARESIIMESMAADEDIANPSGLLVYTPRVGSEKFRTMTAYADMEGWLPVGVIPVGYGPIERGDVVWVVRQGPTVIEHPK